MTMTSASFNGRAHNGAVDDETDAAARQKRCKFCAEYKAAILAK
jgi:hypothetical protein